MTRNPKIHAYRMIDYEKGIRQSICKPHLILSGNFAVLPFHVTCAKCLDLIEKRCN